MLPTRICASVALLVAFAAFTFDENKPVRASGTERGTGHSNSPASMPAGGVPASSCGDGWDPRFARPGVNGQVRAIAADGSGNIYVGGNFLSVGSLRANHIAKWNGSTWQALGTGTTGPVNTIAISGTDVYVGGEFSGAGGLPAQRIAKWNGSSWAPMGAGFNSAVHDIDFLGGDVVAAGEFSQSGILSVNQVAKWTGNSWAPIGSGPRMLVRKLAVVGGSLYAGGHMNTAGYGGLQKWDGTSWSDMTVFGGVSDIKAFGSDLYVAGTFWAVGPNATVTGNVARWNGFSWSGVGSTLGNSFTTATAVEVIGGLVYVSHSGSVLVAAGGSWVDLDAGVAPNIMTQAGGQLLIASQFSRSGAVRHTGISGLNGTGWAPVGVTPGLGLDNTALAVAVSGSDVYVGGSFSMAGETPANRVAKWNGTQWSPLEVGVNGDVTAITVIGSNVYVGGMFSSAGGAPANRIARWNGTDWSLLPDFGSSGTVKSLATSGSDVYAGVGSTVQKWNGSTWTILGTFEGGIGFTGPLVERIAIVGTDLYVVGNFHRVNGLEVNFVAKWNGNTWSTLGSGLDGRTLSIAATGTDIYVGGEFDTAGGVPARGVAKWNGTAWTELGKGAPFARAIAVQGSTVYAGRQNVLSRWDGTGWRNLPFSGHTGNFLELAVSGQELYVAGASFSTPCSSSIQFGIYRDTGWMGAANADWHNTGNWVNGSVPSAGEDVALWQGNASITSADVALDDLTITQGRTLTVDAGRTLTINGKLNLADGKITGPGSVVVVNCDQGALSTGGPTSFIGARLTRCVNGSGPFNFPVGTGSVYSPVELSGIVGSGSVTVMANAGAYPGSPTGLSSNRLQRWWELTNSGISQADLSFTYLQSEVTDSEPRHRIFRISEGSAERVMTLLDTVGDRTVARNVTAFGHFTTAEATPGTASVSGRITTAGGRGIGGIMVTISDGSTILKAGMTNPSGYYRFLNVETERQYVLGTRSKRFELSEPQKLIQLFSDQTNVDFVSFDWQ